VARLFSWVTRKNKDLDNSVSNKPILTQDIANVNDAFPVIAHILVVSHLPWRAVPGLRGAVFATTLALAFPPGQVSNLHIGNEIASLRSQ
jgi:hypothetical protein